MEGESNIDGNPVIYDVYVERILDMKTCVQNGLESTYYMVQWKCTWESELSLKKYCMPFLETFWKQRDKEKKKLLQYAVDEKGKQKVTERCDGSFSNRDSSSCGDSVTSLISSKETSQEEIISTSSQSEQRHGYSSSNESTDGVGSSVLNSGNKKTNSQRSLEIINEDSHRPLDMINEEKLLDMNDTCIFTGSIESEDVTLVQKELWNPVVMLKDISSEINTVYGQPKSPDYVSPARNSVLDNHFQKHSQESNRLLECPRCKGFSTLFPANLKQHMRTKLCRKRASMQRASLLKPKMQQERCSQRLKKLFKCKTCTFSTNHRRDLRLHSLQHAAPDRAHRVFLHHCKSCNFATNKLSNLDKHKVFRHGYEFLVPSKNRNIINKRETRVKDKKSVFKKCRYCDFHSKYPANVWRHEKLHMNANDTMSCEFCSKTFLNKRTYSFHLKTHNHSVTRTGQKISNNKISRNLRRKPSKNVNVVKNDKQQFDGSISFAHNLWKSKLYKCRLCGYKTRLLRLFGCHMRNNHPPDKLNARKVTSSSKVSSAKTEGTDTSKSSCNSYTNNNENTLPFIHSNEAVDSCGFVCPYCFMKLLSNADLEIHLRQHTIENPYESRFKSQSSISELKYIPRKYLNVPVEKASKKEQRDAKMIVAIDFMSIELSVPEKTKVEKTVHVLQNLQVNINPDLSEFMQTPTSENNSVDFCINNLSKIHLHYNNTELGTEKIKCNFCGFIASSQENLEIHQVLHTLKKIYKCRYCNDSFETKATRLQHERQLHGVSINYNEKRSVQCRYCSFTNSLATVQAHEKTHDLEKPFKCKFCCYSAVRKDYVKCHIENIHKI